MYAEIGKAQHSFDQCAHCGSGAGPLARDVRALSGVRAHSAIVMSLAHAFGELPYETLTLKNSTCNWRRSARSNEPLPARCCSRTGRPTDLYDSATEDG
jgi:hypothetical protein